MRGVTSPSGRVKLTAHGDRWVLEIDGDVVDSGRGAAREIIPALAAAARGRPVRVRHELEQARDWLRRTA